MKNLKRILSLMVALVLCLGMASVASAASYDAYPDADEVSYEEAMDVLVALGIIEGTDSGSLDPTGTLTREQAAKIIAYLCLGETSAEIYSEVGSSYAGDATLYVDGEQLEDFPITRNNTVDSVGYLSSETYVYTDSDTYEVTIVVINTYLGEITAVDDGEVTVTVYDSGLSETDANMRQHGVNVSGSYDYETTAFNEDEFVLVTVAGGEIQSMQAAGAVNGVMDALSDDYLVIDGTSYDKSDTYGEHDDSEDNEDYDSEYTFYLDQNGYVLGSEIYEEADADYSSYIYVDGSEVSKNALTGTSAQISVQYLDGTTEILDLYVTESSGKYYYTLNGEKTEIDEGDGDELSDLEDGGFFRYSVNDSGYVSLRSLSSSSQDAAGWVSDTPTISVSSSSRALQINSDSSGYDAADFGDTPTRSVYLNSSTNLYVIDDDEDVTLVSGYDDIKGYSDGDGADENVAILVFYNGNVVEDIYVFGGSYSSSGNYALYVGRYTTSDETYYQFYQDGVTLEYTYDGTLSLITKSVYDLEVSGSTIEDCDLVMSYGQAEEVTRSRTDYFTTDDGTYYYDDDVVVYDYTADNTPATLTGGDYVVFAIDDGLVAAIYIVPDPADEGDGETGSSDITLYDVYIGSGGGALNFTANKADETVYIVVEKFMDSGYTTLTQLTVTTTGDSQYTSRKFTEGDYRVTFYADEDHEELIGTYYLESTYSGT